MNMTSRTNAGAASRRRLTVGFASAAVAVGAVYAACAAVRAAGIGVLSIETSSCPGGTQGNAYAGCTIRASGGKPPYRFVVDSSPSDPTLPEGFNIDSTSGKISAKIIGGQGYYAPKITVVDSRGSVRTQQVTFEIVGRNQFLQHIFPEDSIFHHRVDKLPVDHSPAAAIPAVYRRATLKAFFGNRGTAPFPDGIPAISVPASQHSVAVKTTQYQSYFTAAPIPAYAPVEGTANSQGDRHVLVYQQSEGSHRSALYELWIGTYNAKTHSWNDASNAAWLDTASNALPPQGMGTADAAGLPIAPLLVNADEVIGSGTADAPRGVVRHPIRFTLNHMLNYWVWPATASAGVGMCADSGTPLHVRRRLSQRHPPSSCSSSGPAGEIYRLRANVANPACTAWSPQAAIIITAMRNYGIILADNGISGGLIGTPDSRWNDADLACLKALTLADFEPVNVSSLMRSPESGRTK
jgi:hypothetical protein